MHMGQPLLLVAQTKVKIKAGDIVPLQACGSQHTCKDMKLQIVSKTSNLEVNYRIAESFLCCNRSVFKVSMYWIATDLIQTFRFKLESGSQE